MLKRTIRPANALLYASSVLLIIAATVDCAVYKELPAWQLWGVVALSIAATVWGLYYVTLCYHISAEAITRRVYLRSTHTLPIADITQASLEETDANGIASCHLTLSTAAGITLRLSSDVLNVDDVQELAEDLRTLGLLPPAEKNEKPEDITQEEKKED